MARIGQLVTPRIKTSADALWEDIFSNDQLMGLLMPKPKARKCKTFDKYGVMRLIGVLREHEVYQPLSDRKIMMLLEQNDKDSPYRKFLSMGIEQYVLIVKLRKIIGKHKF